MRRLGVALLDKGLPLPAQGALIQHIRRALNEALLSFVLVIRPASMTI